MIFNFSSSDVTAEGVKYEGGNVGQALSVLEDELTANNTRIYLDYKDGRYGYNTSPLRGADTFNPFSSGLEPVLLWTNPKPNAEIERLTLNIDFSKYEAIMIRVKGYSDLTDPMASMCYMPIPCVESPLASTYSDNAEGTSRKVTVTSSSIYFDWAVYSGRVVNSGCIPLEIYGIEKDFMQAV